VLIIAVIIIVAPVSSSSHASIVAIVGFCLINRHHDAPDVAECLSDMGIVQNTAALATIAQISP
jgi:hypothetical protein